MGFFIKRFGDANRIGSDATEIESISVSNDSGSSFSFTINGDVNLAYGAFYQLFNTAIPEAPLLAFELHEARRVYKDRRYIQWICLGKDIRSFLEERAILRFRAYKCTFKELCAVFLSELSNRHSSVSLNTDLINGSDDVINEFEFANYASKFMEYWQSRGYRLYFNHNLELVANLEASRSQLSVLSMDDGRTFNVSGYVDIVPGDLVRVEPSGKLCKVVSIVGNKITLNRDYSNDSTFIVRSPSYNVRLDAGYDKHLIDGDNAARLSLELKQRPTGQFWISATNVEDVAYTTQSFVADGKVGNSYALTGVPSPPSNVNITFGGDDNALLEVESIVGSDQIKGGKITVNPLIGNTIANNQQYRNYRPSIDSSKGVMIGGSIELLKTSGECVLFGACRQHTSTISDFLFGFWIKNRSLGIVYLGNYIATDFPELIPTIEREVLSSNKNKIVVSDSDGFAVGQNIIFRVGENLNSDVFGTIVSITGNELTLMDGDDITFIPNLKALQIEDYILKYTYSQGQLTYWGKSSTDPEFRLLATKSLLISEDRLFVRLYTNQEHSVSIDFIDITDGIKYTLRRRGNGQEDDRVLDIAYENSASMLRSEVQLTDKTLKFNASEPLIKIIDEVLNTRQFRIADVNDLVIGDRVLIADKLAYITVIDSSTMVITVDRDINDVLVVRNDMLIKTNNIPASRESIEFQYVGMSDQLIQKCNCGTIDGSNKGVMSVTIGEDMSENQAFSFQDYKDFAQNELNKYCRKQVNGSFKIVLSNEEWSDTYLKSGFAELPYVGQLIEVTAPFHFTELHGCSGYISGMTYTQVGDSFTISCQVGDINDLSTLLTRLKRGIRGTVVKLVDDSLPKKDMMCEVSEYMLVTEDWTFTTKMPISFVCGAYPPGECLVARSLDKWHNPPTVFFNDEFDL